MTSVEALYTEYHAGGDKLRVTEDGFESYFKPEKETRAAQEPLRKLDIGYTKTAPAYLFKRVRQPLLCQ
ncbi:MAG: hypothetical protein B6D68_02460 [spirochete symbiont of Stewartia floridana]|nr:MAG: hypothetical protein B6D68_02460 [spirochete symbiont of Stewartia floridana]